MTSIVEVVEQHVDVTVEADESVVVAETMTTSVVEVGVAGPQGPAGPQGAPGAGGIYYVHQQNVSSATWTINHGLGAEPNVHVQTSAGQTVLVAPEYPDVDTVVIRFLVPVTGRAVLS